MAGGSLTGSVPPEASIPAGQLPPLRAADLPPALPWRKMLGPSLLLAGLSLGSGEFVLWPYIVYKSGFVFFWAAVIGVVTQFFLNMEIERWTLATGESAVTAFCRLSRQFGWIFLLLNVLPHAWPGWATGAGQILSWMLLGAKEATAADGTLSFAARHVSAFGIGGLLLVGVVLTAGPVVYKTVERIQVVLVALILVLVVVMAALVVRPDAIVAMGRGVMGVGALPDPEAGLGFVLLLGALAFAGAGGTTNLGQSNFIKDKGYGMGRFIGRITSPITGEEEATSEIGYSFPRTPENMARWRAWWKAANVEHFFSFLVTCLVCLCLMALITYSLLRDESGALKPGMQAFGSGIGFVWGQAAELSGRSAGAFLRFGFLAMGVAVLLTTELGILDTVSRISADIVKTQWLLEDERWSLSKLYYLFLWAEILIGVVILLIPGLGQPLFLLKTSAAMNGGVMFLYSILLFVVGARVLPPGLRMRRWRAAAILWSCVLFGYFSFEALRLEVLPFLLGE